MKNTLLDRAYNYMDEMKDIKVYGYDAKGIRDDIVKKLMSILPKKKEPLSTEIYKLAQELKEMDCNKYTSEKMKTYAYHRLVTIINYEILCRF